MAFLFSNARFGMANEDVYRCHVALTIPTNPAFGSLNLAAAVQVFAYEWRMADGARRFRRDRRRAGPTPPAAADARAVADMLEHSQQALIDFGFLDPDAPRNLMSRLKQIADHAQLGPKEIDILRDIAKAVREAAGNAKP